MISDSDIRHIARLARLSLTEKEVKTYSEQLSGILDHFKQLQELNTQNVEPLVTSTDMPTTVREDVVVQGFGAEGGLSNAPDRSGDLYKVPAVL